MATKQKLKTCQICKTRFRGRRDAKTCSAACRKRLQRTLRAELAEKAARLESAVGKEFHRLAGQLFENHVLHLPQVLADERGAIAAPMLDRPAQRISEPEPEVVPVTVHKPVPQIPVVQPPAAQELTDNSAVSLRPLSAAEPVALEPQPIEPVASASAVAETIPVAVEPTPVAVKPEPVAVAVVPEPVAAEPAPIAPVPEPQQTVVPVTVAPASAETTVAEPVPEPAAPVVQPIAADTGPLPAAEELSSAETMTFESPAPKASAETGLGSLASQAVAAGEIQAPGPGAAQSAAAGVQDQASISDDDDDKTRRSKPFSLFRFNRVAFLTTSGAMAVIALLVVGGFLLAHFASNKAAKSTQLGANYNVGQLKLGEIKPNGELELGAASQLAVNGVLRVNNTIVVTPTTRPSKPVTGQIYYDKTTNTPYYYNGTQFISFSPEHITSIGGSSGVIGLGNGLNMVNNQLSISDSVFQQIAAAASSDFTGNVVTSFQGQTGAVTISGGPGIAINGTTITNGGVLSLAGTPNQVSVSGSTGNITLTLPQDIATTSSPTFGGLTVSGTASVGTLQQTTPGSNLNISAGSDNISFTAGGRTFIFPTSGPGSQTICTTGISCASGGGQAVLLQPGSSQTDTGSGPSIFINNTGGGALVDLQSGGVDRFVVDNTGNVTSGTINGQTISSAANFTGTLGVAGATTLTGQLNANGGIVTNNTNINAGSGTITSGAINGQTISTTANFTGTLAVQGAGGLTLGVPGTTAGSLNFGNTSSNRQVILQGMNPSGVGNATIFLPSIAGGSSDTICLASLGNCAGSGGGIVGNGTAGSIAKFTNGNTIADSGLSEAGNTLTYAGNAVINAANGFVGNLLNLEVNGSSKLVVDQTGNIVHAGTLTVNGTGASSIAGSLSVGTGLSVTSGGATIGGTVTLSSLNTAGVVHTNGSGVLSTSPVVLGTDTTGNYVMNLGALTGLTTTGNTGAGSTPTLSITYGATANTSVQGNTTLTCASGTGNLSGGGDVITLGSGGTCSNITITNSPVFTGTLAVQGGGGITVGVPGTTAGVINLSNGTNTNLSVINSVAPTGSGNATYSLPAIAGGSSDTLCLRTLANCNASGPAGGDLAGSYPDPTIAKLQGTTLTLSSLASGDVLQYNGSAIVNGHITNANLSAGTFSNITGVGTLSSGSIATGFGTIVTANNITTSATIQGNIVNATGTLQVGGADINTPSTLSNVAYLTAASQTFTGANTFNAAGTAVSITNNASIGGIGTIGTLAVTNNATVGGTLGVTGITTLTGQVNANGGVVTNNANINAGSGTITSGNINGQTISSTANFTGTLAVQGGTLTVGVPGTTAGSLNLANAGSTRQVILQGLNPTGTGNATIQLPSIAGGATDTVCLVALGNCAGSGGGITGSGTSGTIAVFTGTGSIGNSTLTQSGSTLTASGNVVIQGANSLALGTASTNTGSIMFNNSTNANTLILQAGATSTNLTFTLPTTAGANGDCLQTNGSGVLSFASCTGGTGGGVTSLDGLIGVLTLNNSSGSGSAITIDNAKADASTKGIATFNATNFSDNGSGVINTIQNIATSSSPVFVSPNGTTGINTGAGAGTQRIDASGNLVNIGNLTGSSAVAIASGGTNQNLTLDGSGSGQVQIGGTSTGDILLGGGVSGTGCTVTNATGALSCTGAINSSTAGLQTAGTTRIDNSGNATLGTITSGLINGQTISSAANFTGNVTIQGANALTLGTSSTNTGAIVFRGSGGTGTLTLQGPTTPNAGNYTLTIPAITANDTVCVATLANCAATGTAGGDLTGTYPNPTIAKLQGTTLTLSSLSSGDVLQYNGSAVVNGHITNTNLTAGTFSSITGVGALNAGSITSGFGVISTANNISTSAALHGGTLTVGSTNQFQVDASGNATTSGTLAVQGSGGISIGVASTTNGVLNFANSTNSNLTVVQSAAPSGSGNATINLPTIAGGTSDTICLVTLGNCGGSGGGITGSGTSGTIAVFTGTSTIGNSILSQSGSTLTVGGNIVANTAPGFTGNLINLEVNGSSKFTVDQIGSSTQAGTLTVNGTGASAIAGSLSVGTGLTVSDGGANVTGNSLFKPTTNSATSFVIQNAGGANNLFVVDSTANKVAIGPSAVPANAVLTVGTNTTTAAGGIYFGTDTNLYRSAVSTLKTDGGFVVGTLGSSGTTVLCSNGGQISTCGSSAGSGNYIFNQSSQQTSANFNIDGTGVIGTSLTVPLLQSAAATALTITGNAASTFSTTAGNLTLQAGSGTVSLGTSTNLTAAGALTVAAGGSNQNLTLSSSGTGKIIVKPGTDSNNAFQVQRSGGTAVLTVNTSATPGVVISGGSGASAGAELFTGSESFPATTGWTAISGTGSSATATHTAGGGTTALSPTPALSITNGNTYQVNFTVSGSPTAGESVTPSIGGANGIAIYGNSASESQIITATGTGNLAFTPTNNWNGTISSVSIKLITQATAALTVNGNTFNGTGNINLYAGFSSGLNNTTGTLNAGYGFGSLQNNTTGSNNTANGIGSLAGNTTGSNNTALGNSVLTANTTGSNNVGLGYLAGFTNVTANRSVTGSGNTFLGAYSGPGSTAQLQNSTAIGVNSVVSQSNSIVLGCVSGVNGCTTTTKVGILTASPAYTLDVGGDINISSGSAYRINGVDINTAGTLSNVAYLNQTQTFSGLNTFNDLLQATKTGTTAFAVTGAPGNSATSSLIQIGSAITGGNNSANGGTYIGLNAPGSGAGSNADLVNLQVGGSSKFKVTSGGAIATGGTNRLDGSGNLLNIGNITLTGAITGGTTITGSGNINTTGGTLQTNSVTRIDNSGNGTLADLSVSGIATIGTLGTTNTSTFLCRNASNQVAGCATTGSGSPFVQGGNSFGATAVLGTNDNNSLQVRTNGNTQVTIGTNGATTFQNSADSTTAFQIQNQAGTSNLFVADTTNGKIGIGQTPTSGGTALQVTGGVTIAGGATVTSGILGVASNIQLNGTTTSSGYISKGAFTPSGVTANDVVVLNSSGQAIDTTTARDTRVYGVAISTAAPGGTTGVAITGNFQVTATTAAVSVGDQLVTSTTSGQVMADNNATTGILGIALSSKGAGSSGLVNVAIRPVNGQSTPRFQNTSNSTSAFQIQNAAGQNVFAVDTTNQRIAIGPAAIPANGVLTVGTNTTVASGGIYFGTDTNLYRSGTSELSTDGTLAVGGDFYGAGRISTELSSDTDTRAALDQAAGGAGNAGLLLGPGTSTADTNLYRSAAGVLKTDGSLTVVGTITSGLINGQTVSSAANFTGTVAVATTATFGTGITVGTPGTNVGTINLSTSASNSRQVILQGLNPSGTGNATIQFPTIAGGATDTVCLVSLGNCAGSGGGITGSGTNGTIPVFTGTGSIGNSTLTQSGSALTASGTLTVQGANALTLGTATGNTGAVLFKNSTNSNTLTLLSGASGSSFTLTLPTTAGSNGDCLQSNGSGVLSFASCTGGVGGGVTSLDGLIGVLTINNSSGGGSAITIDNAAANGTTKGIATFNATNFTASSGVVNTIQDIATSSSPVFVSPNATTGVNTGAGAGTQRIDASGNLVNIGTITSGLINGQTISSSANFTGTLAVATSVTTPTLTSTGALSVSAGGTNQNLTLNGSGSGQVRIGGTSTGDILIAGGSGTTGCTIANSTGNLNCDGTINGATISAGTLSGGTFSGGTVSGGSLSATAVNGLTVSGGVITGGSIASGFGTISTGNNITTTATVQGGTLNATSAIQLGGADINTAGTLSNVAYENQANDFTLAQTISNAGGKTTLALTSTGSNTGITLGGDTTIYRSAASTLKTDGSLQVTGSIGANCSVAKICATTAGIGLNVNVTGSSDSLDLQNNGTTVFAVANTGVLSLGASSSATGAITFRGSGGAGTLTLQGPTTPNVGNYTLTIPTITANDTICVLTLANCSFSGSAAGGDLSGTYPNPTVANLQGTTLTLSSLASGDVLQYNGSAIVNGHITNANLTAGTFSSITGTGALTVGSIASGFGTISTGNNITTTATVQGGTVNATTAIQLGGADINTASTLSNVAYLNASNTFTGTTNTFSATGGTSLAVTGAPAASATSSLIQIGSAIAGGSTNGTYIGLNAPSSGPGSSANLIDLQVNGVSRFKVDTSGNTNVNGNVVINTSSLTNGAFSKTLTAGTGGVTANDVVVLANDSGNARVIDSTTPRDTRVIGVAAANAAASGTVTVRILGNFQVTADTAAVAIGDQLVTSTTSGQVTVDNNATTGILGIATSAKSGGSSGLVSVYIKPINGQYAPKFQNASNSTSAFQIQNAAGTSNLFVADTTNTRIAIGQATANYTLDVNGDINVTTGNVYRLNGVAGASTTCSGGQFLQNQVVSGGITTGGTCAAAGGGITTVGTIDTQTKSANGAVISGSSIYLQTADGSAPGLVSTGTQTFAGAKTFTGAATFQNASNSTTAFQIQNSAGTSNLLVADTTNTRIGIGTASPNTTLSIYNGNSSTTQTDFTQALNKGGINIITDYNDVSYTPGIFWSTQNNNSGKPKAGIYMYEDNANGTSLLFGTSNGYTTGITNTALTLGPKGSALFKNSTDSSTGFQVQDSSGAGLLTVNTTLGVGSVGVSKLTIDTLGSSGSTALCLNGSNQVSTCSGGSGITTVGTIDTQTKSANGAVISGSSIYLQTADASNPGLVSTSAQTFAGNKTFNGDILGASSATGTTGTSSGTGGTNVTTITLASAGSFANGDVILVDNTGGSGQDYYTRITAGGGTTTLTVSPAVSYGTAAGYTGNATITKYTVQNIGAVTSTNDYTTQANRFFQGYFLGGVVTGAGSTTLSDARLASTVGMNFNSLSYIFQNTSNSTTAFQIQNASAQSVFVADTTNQQVAIGPAAVPANGVLTIGTNTTAATGGIYFGTDTNLYRSTTSTLQTDSTLSVKSNLYVTGQISTEQSGDNNTRAALNQTAGGVGKAGLLLGDGNLTPDVNLYRDSVNLLKTDDALTVAGLLTGSAGLTVTGTTTINGTGSGTTTIGSTGSGGAVTVQSSSTIGITSGTTLSLASTGANAININPGGGSNTGVVVKPTTNSNKAFQVQNAAGTTTVFNVDTTSLETTIKGDLIIDNNGNSSIGNLIMNNGSIVNNNGFNLVIDTSDGLNIQNASGTLANFSYTNGSALFQNTTNSTTAFQIQNTSNVALFNVDTTNSKLKVDDSATLLSMNIDSTGLTYSTISRTNRTSDESATAYGTGSYTPAGTFTPGANKVLVAYINYEPSSGQVLPADSSNITLSGGSLTWTPITGKTQQSGSSWGVGFRAFYAVTNGSPPSNMQVTTDSGAFNIHKYEVTVDEMSGVDTTTPVAGAVAAARTSNASNTWTATLAATPVAADWKVTVGTLDQDNATHAWNTPGGWSEIATISALRPSPDPTIQNQTSSTSTTLNYALTSGVQYANADTAYGGFILKSATTATLNVGTSTAGALNIGNSSSLTTFNGTFAFQGGASTTCTGGQVLTNQVVTGGIVTGGTCSASGSSSLQGAYDGGNTVTATDARDISFTLANTTTDPNFLVNIATGSGSKFAVQSNSTDVFSVTSSALQVAGVSTLGLQVAASGTLSVGTTIQTSTLNLGNTSASSTTLINGGTGASAISIQQGTAGTVSIGTTNAGTVSIGATGSTANATTVNIANTTGASIQTVNIGSNSNVASITTIMGGNGAGAITLTPQTTGTIVIGAAAGTGAISLGSSTGAQTVNVGAGNTGIKTVNIGTGTAANVINIGTGQAAGTISIGTAITTGAITIGGSAQTTGITTIRGGTGTTGIALTPGTAGGIVIGAAAGTGAITLGSSTAAQTVNIGTGASGANNQAVNIGTTLSGGAGIKTITIGGTNSGSNGLNVVTILAGNNSGSTTTGQSTGINVSLGSTASTTAVCSSLASATNPTSGTAYELRDCSGTPVADFAENYPVASDVSVGDVVSMGTRRVNTYGTDPQNAGAVDWTHVIGRVTEMVKSNQAYQHNAVGIVSDNTSNFSSVGYNIKEEDNPKAIALNGRVPVKFSPENGPLEPGDYITTSATMPGYAMKATGAGYVIGQALDDYTDAGPGLVMVFVKNFYYPGPTSGDYLQNGGNATLSSLNVTGTAEFSNLNTSGTATITDLVVTGSATIGTLIVTGTAHFTGDIIIDGHVITAGGQPTGQVLGAASTGATVSVSGTDTTGTITITTGSAPTAGDLAKILFSKTYGQAPHIVLSASNDKAAGLRFFKGTTSATDFMFNALDNPQPNTTYTFDYFIAQ